ncbi:MAG: Na+/H+ antiporter subunit E [Pseudomonadota bacterium]
MNIFAINLLLAFAWGALAADYSITSLAIGFVLGFAALWVVRGLFPDEGYFLRVPRLVRLALIFLRELVLSSLRVARDVLSLRPNARPGIVAVPLRARTETEVLVVSSLVTLTPGTLSLDLSPDGETLYVHAMFLDEPEAMRAEIRDTLETPVLEALS